jgi:hypothetical protein
MKKTLATIVAGDVYKKIATITTPYFIKYAERFDADFVILNGKDKNSWGTIHFINIE